MISDCDQRRGSIKSLRSASLVSSLFESATSIIHPLAERFEPSVDIEFDSPCLSERPRHSLFDSSQLSHVCRSSTAFTTATPVASAIEHCSPPTQPNSNNSEQRTRWANSVTNQKKSKTPCHENITTKHKLINKAAAPSQCRGERDHNSNQKFFPYLIQRKMKNLALKKIWEKRRKKKVII